MKCKDCQFWKQVPDNIDYGRCSEPNIVSAETKAAAQSDYQNPDLFRHKNDNCLSILTVGVMRGVKR